MESYRCVASVERWKTGEVFNPAGTVVSSEILLPNIYCRVPSPQLT